MARVLCAECGEKDGLLRCDECDGVYCKEHIRGIPEDADICYNCSVPDLGSLGLKHVPHSYDGKVGQ